MADEMCHDEVPDDTQKRMKIGVYIVALDALINQMDDRFPESNLTLFCQMSLFTEKSLKSSPFNVKKEDISHICEMYGFDEAIKELENFRLYYVDLDDDNQSNKPIGQEITVALARGQPDSSSSGSESEGEGKYSDVQRAESIYKH
jgi:hypothetical protein